MTYAVMRPYTLVLLLWSQFFFRLCLYLATTIVFLLAYWSAVVNVSEKADIKSAGRYFAYTYQDNSNKAIYYTNNNMRIKDVREDGGMYYQSFEDDTNIYLCYEFPNKNFNNLFIISYLVVYFQGTQKSIELAYSVNSDKPIAAELELSLSPSKLFIGTTNPPFSSLQNIEYLEFENLESFLTYSHTSNQSNITSDHLQHTQQVR